MELFVHFTLDKRMFNLSTNVDAYPSSLSLAFRAALESPYFMYQILAYSARHLAFLRPERFSFYFHQAVSLQTRAVSLFNATGTEVNRSNCVSILLFSSVLGQHLLTDTLAKREQGGLIEFLEHYIQCVEMHRSTYTIASTAWPLLIETELEPILSKSAKLTSQPPRGNHCQRVQELLDHATGLDQDDKESCRKAIQDLQVGFDEILDNEKESEPGANRYEMIFLWPMLTSPRLTTLLAARTPEALIVLGYYATLLHHGRSMWQVGNAGAYLLDIIMNYFGSDWDYWLAYPLQVVLPDRLDNR